MHILQGVIERLNQQIFALNLMVSTSYLFQSGLMESL